MIDFVLMILLVKIENVIIEWIIGSVFIMCGSIFFIYLWGG